jgi:hypothetical protein
MRKLSSGWTWFYKFAFPTLWIGSFGLGTVAMFVAPDSLATDPRGVRWLFPRSLACGHMDRVFRPRARTGLVVDAEHDAFKTHV